MKRKIMAMLSIMLLLVMASTAMAAIPGDISTGKYIKAYVRGTQNVAVFRDSSLRTRGNSLRAYNAAVYPTDEIRIYQMNGSVAYIGYIAGKTWAKAYIPTSAITLNNSSQDGQRFSSGVGHGSVFARPNGTVYSGSAIDAGDTVWKLAEENGYTQVVYPAGSVYKMAWIRSGDYNSRVGGRVDPIPVPQPVTRDTYVSPAEGDYYLLHEANTGFALDVTGGGAAPVQTMLQLYNRNNTDAQIFHIKRISGDWHIIQHKRTGHVVNVQWGGSSNGTRLWLYYYDKTASCHWRFIKQDNGSYLIQSQLSGNPILELQNNSVYAGGRIQLWARHAGQAGRWKLEKVATAPTPVPATTKFRYPLNNIYVCGNNWMTKYSKRPSRPYHAGIDVKSSSGDKMVYATADGTVAASGWNSANGNFVILQHVLNGKTIYSFYCHMSKRSVSKGNSVKGGTPIGIIGNTGSASAGEHLHFVFVDKLMASGGYWGYVTSTGKAVTYQGYTFYSPAFVIDNQRLP